MRQVLAALGEEDPVNCNHCTNCQKARRCSHGAGLDTAVKKLKEEFGISKHDAVYALYTAFEKLDINPITLPNNSACTEVPSIRKMIQKSI